MNHRRGFLKTLGVVALGLLGLGATKATPYFSSENPLENLKGWRDDLWAAATFHRQASLGTDGRTQITTEVGLVLRPGLDWEAPTDQFVAQYLYPHPGYRRTALVFSAQPPEGGRDHWTVEIRAYDVEVA